MVNEKIVGSNSSKFSWRTRWKSFVHAWEGIVWFLKKEHNAPVHLSATVTVLVLSVSFGVDKTEAIAVVFSLAFVWVAEMINTAIEKTIDLVSPAYHPMAKIVKDVAPGAVLIASLAALFTGCIIFLPKILSL